MTSLQVWLQVLDDKDKLLDLTSYCLVWLLVWRDPKDPDDPERRPDVPGAGVPGPRRRRPRLRFTGYGCTVTV